MNHAMVHSIAVGSPHVPFNVEEDAAAKRELNLEGAVWHNNSDVALHVWVKVVSL